MLTLTPSRPLSQWWWLVLLTTLIITADRLGWSRPVTQTADLLIVPVKQQLWQWSAVIRQPWQNWQTRQTDQQEISRLQTQLAQQTQTIALLGGLQTENQQLRRLLQAPLNEQWSFLPARVIGLHDQTAVINRGQAHGVDDGMMVVALSDEQSSQGILVGKIINVHPRQADVRLISQPDHKIPVLIRNQLTAKKISTGLLESNSEAITVYKLPTDDVISAGDVVITNGQAFDSQGNGWLADIPIGLVTQVQLEQETDVFQTATVKWLVDPWQLDQVFVVTKW